MTKFEKKNELAKKKLNPQEITIVWSAYNEESDNAFMMRKKYTGQFNRKSKEDCYDLITDWMSKKEDGSIYDNQDEEVIYYADKIFYCEYDLIDYIKGY